MKLTRTITIDGKTNEEYHAIVAHLEALQQQFTGWTLNKEPLVNRVTAVNIDEITEIPR